MIEMSCGMLTSITPKLDLMPHSTNACEASSYISQSEQKGLINVKHSPSMYSKVSVVVKGGRNPSKDLEDRETTP